MLVVTSSVWMVNGVHGYSSYNRPHFSLGLELPVLGSCLQKRLFISSSSGNNSDHGSCFGVNGLSDTRGQFDSCLLAIFTLSNNSGVSARCSGELTFISISILDIADKSSFRDFSHWQYISDIQRCLASAVDVLSGVHSLTSQIIDCFGLITILVSKLDFGERSSSARVVDDFSDHSSYVSLSFCVVQFSIPGFCYSFEVMCSVYWVWSSFSLWSNSSTHVRIYKFYFFI